MIYHFLGDLLHLSLNSVVSKQGFRRTSGQPPGHPAFEMRNFVPGEKIRENLTDEPRRLKKGEDMKGGGLGINMI